MLGTDSLKVVISQYSEVRYPVIRYQFPEAIDLSGFDYIAFYWHSGKSGKEIAIRMISNYPTDQYSFAFKETFTGWVRLIIPINWFRVEVGTPNWHSIKYFAITVQQAGMDHAVSFNVDRITADKGITDYYLISLEKLQT